MAQRSNKQDRKYRKKNSKALYIIYIACIFVFFYLPIVVTMVFSFNSSKSLTRMTGFSFRWYERLINDGSIMKAVYVSLTIAIFATVISTVLGTITAISLSKNRKIVKDVVHNINNITIMSPDIVTAIGLMILFSSVMISKGYFTMLLSHIAFCTPYVITSVYPKVRQLDPSIADAAMDLGATPFEALTKVIIPMLKDGIYAGVLLAFTMSFDDFVISYFVTGNGVENISIIVYNMTKRTNPTINALSTIVILVIVILIICSRLMPHLIKTHAKKLLITGGILVIALAIFAGVRSGGRTLRVYNAGEYIDPEILAEFESEYNCKVVYETFDSNESMYTKLKSGAEYDILVPSDYMIERLIREEMLQPINWDNIPNAKGLNPDIMNLAYDPGNVYSVPYFVGTVGILYDTTVVDEEDLKEGWEVLRNPKYAGNVYMYDSERDSFMIALKACGYSMNTESTEEYQKAYEWLIDQRNTMDVVYAGDDVIDNMISGNKALAVVYSGDGAYIMCENENMDYIDPQQGTNEWCDGMVMTTNCNDEELAECFMNYMLEPDVASRNSIFVGYTSPVKAVADELAETEFEGISAYVPVFGGAKNEVFRYQELKLKQYIADLWTKVKAY
ncbi:MAG: extracellular solute-binding protein [Lachnospiraceae bacterium]|nr:extracellular solute-binding protein [Lachnospiraceae bacterium]